MNSNTPKFKVRLGMFIAGGLAIFGMAIFLIGKQQNLFNPVFKLTSTFHNVSGLLVGSNIRFAGIDVGTVDNIRIINDSTVQVDMLIRRTVQQFIKADCEAGIGSAGIMGDRVLTITQGSNNSPVSRDGQQIASKEPIEMDAIMASLKVTANNAEIISDQLTRILRKIDRGNGTLWRLIQDTTMAGNINQTIMSLENSSRGLDENMNAAKESFLLKGYFKRKEKAAQKMRNEDEQKSIEEQKRHDENSK